MCQMQHFRMCLIEISLFICIASFMQSIFPLCFPQMLKLCSELEMVVSCHEAKRDKLRETKEL